VIAGHLDRPGGSPAVFWNLRDLQASDTVMIKDMHGKTLQFRVTHVASYPPRTAPFQAIFGASNGASLNLITCAGDWVASEQQTALRLVVYTSLIG
jgi:sortase (surface protein transpeptidase)